MYSNLNSSNIVSNGLSKKGRKPILNSYREYYDLKSNRRNRSELGS